MSTVSFGNDQKLSGIKTVIYNKSKKRIIKNKNLTPTKMNKMGTIENLEQISVRTKSKNSNAKSGRKSSKRNKTVKNLLRKTNSKSKSARKSEKQITKITIQKPDLKLDLKNQNLFEFEQNQ